MTYKLLLSVLALTSFFAGKNVLASSNDIPDRTESRDPKTTNTATERFAQLEPLIVQLSDEEKVSEFDDGSE